MRGIKRIAGTAIAVGVLAAAGCGGGDKPVGSASSSSNPSSSTSTGAGQFKKGGTVTIANVGGQTWPCQFNPFNPSVNQVALGFVYEPLTFVNVLKAGATTPMLATDFTWSPAKDSIVFTIRDGRFINVHSKIMIVDDHLMFRRGVRAVRVGLHLLNLRLAFGL